MWRGIIARFEHFKATQGLQQAGLAGALGVSRPQNPRVTLGFTQHDFEGGRAPDKGARVTVVNRGQLILPAILRVTFWNGTRRGIRVPVETWMQSGSHVFAIDAAAPVFAFKTQDGDPLPHGGQGALSVNVIT